MHRWSLLLYSNATAIGSAATAVGSAPKPFGSAPKPFGSNATAVGSAPKPFGSNASGSSVQRIMHLHLDKRLVGFDQQRMLRSK